MEIITSEFFKNMKTLPPPASKEFQDLVNWEEQKILGGVNINGVHISGWLYWHLNHWKIRIDDTDSYGNSIRIESLPELRDNEWIRAEALERCRVEKKGYMEIGGRQGGKALINSALLYTPNGEITIGKCSIGDLIYDESGKLTTIIGKHPQGKKSLEKISFVDGREIICDLNHKWSVYDRFLKKDLIKTTEELKKDFKRYKASWNKRKNPYEYRYSIYNNKPVQYTQKELPLTPYFLGLWLGDGVDTFMITSGKTGGNKLHNYLKENLYNNKHIPDCYMYSSVEDRMELLRGLMDSDGSCDKSGSIEFSSSIPQLANDFYKLCRGLGIVLSNKIKKTSYKKEGIKIPCKDSNRFVLFTSLPIFKLKRKLNNIKSIPKYENRITITNIEYAYDDFATCITVDNNSHLFLTDNYTPTHNSEMEASFFGMNSIMFKLTQNVIVCGNDNDLSLLKDKVDFGLKNIWQGINIPRLDKTWRSNQIRLGYKKPNGDDDIWSYIVIRNAKDGHNTEVSAGTTAKSFIMDEVGKYSFSQAYEAGVPAMKGSNGFRAIPILVGTGGSFTHGKDAENFFGNPKANNFLSFKDEKTGKETCLFLSGLFRQDCKIQTNLADYLISLGKEVKSPEELRKIKIKVSDTEKALQVITEEREASKKNPDKTIYLKKVMYYPLTVEECFLSDSDNIFDIEAAKRQKLRLLTQERTGTPVVLFEDEGGIKHEFTDKLPITNFPLNPQENKDAPIVIYEFPPENPPYGLYTAGVDPYRQGKSQYSSSLGSVYIYKRMHDLTGEKYQDMIVASYCARPDKKDKWEEQARLLIKLFNARALCENDEISFIETMKAKGDAHYLEKQPEWLKEIVPNTTVSRDYGVHRSSDKIRDFLHNCLKKYLETPILTEKDENGNVTRQILGIHKILDPVLLEEIIQYNDKEGNFDRVIAVELAIAQAMKMDPIFGKITKEDDRLKSLKGGKERSKLFNRSGGLFNTRKNKLFKNGNN